MPQLPALPRKPCQATTEEISTRMSFLIFFVGQALDWFPIGTHYWICLYACAKRRSKILKGKLSLNVFTYHHINQICVLTSPQTGCKSVFFFKHPDSYETHVEDRFLYLSYGSMMQLMKCCVVQGVPLGPTSAGKLIIKTSLKNLVFVCVNRFLSYNTSC